MLHLMATAQIDLTGWLIGRGALGQHGNVSDTAVANDAA